MWDERAGVVRELGLRTWGKKGADRGSCRGWRGWRFSGVCLLTLGIVSLIFLWIMGDTYNNIITSLPLFPIELY